MGRSNRRAFDNVKGEMVDQLCLIREDLFLCFIVSNYICRIFFGENTSVEFRESFSAVLLNWKAGSVY